MKWDSRLVRRAAREAGVSRAKVYTARGKRPYRSYAITMRRLKGNKQVVFEGSNMRLKTIAPMLGVSVDLLFEWSKQVS